MLCARAQFPEGWTGIGLFLRRANNCVHVRIYIHREKQPHSISIGTWRRNLGAIREISGTVQSKPCIRFVASALTLARGQTLGRWVVEALTLRGMGRLRIFAALHYWALAQVVLHSQFIREMFAASCDTRNSFEEWSLPSFNSFEATFSCRQ